MNQYDRLFDFTVSALLQLAPALSVVALLATRVLNPRTASRFRAALIDILIAGLFVMTGWMFVAAFAIGSAGPIPGAAMGAIYLIFRDAMLTDMTQRRSVGKKLMRLRLVSRSPGRSPILVSVARNLVFLTVVMVGVNLVWGRVVLNVVVIVESLLICLNPKGMRIGDHLANSRVLVRERRQRKSTDQPDDSSGRTMSDRRSTSRPQSGWHRIRKRASGRHREKDQGTAGGWGELR